MNTYMDKKKEWFYFNKDTIISNTAVKMRWNASNKSYYIDRGYECVNWKERFYVNIEDLQKGSNVRIEVLCTECKKQRVASFNNIIKIGHSKCFRCSQFIDEKGNIYGRLIVREQGYNIDGATSWLCECECGVTKDIRGHNLRNGSTISCGCYQIEMRSGENNHMFGRTGDAHPMFGRTGINHPTYNHDLTDTDREKKRNTSSDRHWGNEIKELDDFTCQCCGQIGYELESHHLNGYKDFPEQRLDLDNGVTLCKKCHKQFHSWMGGYQVTCARSDFVQFCEELYPDALFLTKSI